MNQEIKITHSGVDIVWDDKLPAWVFSARGREYALLKLEDCKARIDKVPPGEKPEFKRVKAWASDYSQGLKEIEVTSVCARPGYRGAVQVWTIDLLDKQRRMQDVSSLFEDSEGNRLIVAKIKDLREQRQALDTQVAALTERMTPFKLVE